MAILVVDKLKGISSYDVIRILQRRCKLLGIVRTKEGKKPQAPKMGHSGTLDPLASGVMIVATDGDTKQIAQLIGLEKEYIADIMLGKRTASGDLEGEVIEERAVPELLETQVHACIEQLKGKINLPVPLYSAIKKDGKALYAYARAGKTVDVPIKTMEVLDARLESIHHHDKRHPVLRVWFKVSSGTYIRSLAEELARRLTTVGTLQDLRRISVGPYRIEDAVSPDVIDLSCL